MKNNFLFLIFLAFTASAQRPVKFVLDKITTDDSGNLHRKFTVDYHIENTSGKDIAFVLKPIALIPVTASSGSYNPHYKLLQNNKSIDVSGIFTWPERSFRNQEEYNRYVDSISRTEPDVETMKRNRSLAIMNSIMRLKKDEKRSFTAILYWDRERYQKQDENEYFLSADAKSELELSMHLQKEELKNRLDEAAFEKLMSDPELIHGWFTSNRLEIDLSDKKTEQY